MKINIMENKINEKLEEDKFLQILFYSHAFWRYFHNLYLEFSKSCSANTVFFEHTWIIICIKKYESVSITDLVRISHKKQSALSRAVSVLEKGGYISKNRKGKMFILSLTKEGMKLYEHLEKIYAYLDKLFKRKVSEEKINQLISLFKEINTKLEITYDNYLGETF